MRRSMQVPGPGNYENHEKLKMDAKGNYQYSKWRSSGAPVFSRSRRNTNLETSVTRKSKYYGWWNGNSYTWSRHVQNPKWVRVLRDDVCRSI